MRESVKTALGIMCVLFLALVGVSAATMAFITAPYPLPTEVETVRVVWRDRFTRVEYCGTCKPVRSARIACASCCRNHVGKVGEDKSVLHFEVLTCAESCVRAVEGLCEDATWVKNECPRLVEGY